MRKLKSLQANKKQSIPAMEFREIGGTHHLFLTLFFLRANDWLDCDASPGQPYAALTAKRGFRQTESEGRMVGAGSDLHSWCFGNSGKGELLGRSGCVCFFLAGSEVLAMTLLMVE